MDYLPIFIFAIVLAGMFSVFTDIDNHSDLTKQEEDVCDA